MTNEITSEQAQAEMDKAVAAKAVLEAQHAKERAGLKAHHKEMIGWANKEIAKAGRLVAAASKADSRAKAEAKAKGQVTVYDPS